MNNQKILYDYAMKMVGLPYMWGGDDTISGFDCSGLCIEMMQAMGVVPKWFDTTAHGLMHHKKVKPITTAQFGALCFYGRINKATHVGLCLNDETMLEAGGGNSKTVNATVAGKQNAYVRIRPIKSRSDLLGYGWPDWPWNPNVA